MFPGWKKQRLLWAALEAKRQELKGCPAKVNLFGMKEIEDPIDSIRFWTSPITMNECSIVSVKLKNGKAFPMLLADTAITEHDGTLLLDSKDQNRIQIAITLPSAYAAA